VIVIEPGAVATELTDHITHGQTKQGVEQFYAATAITADDIAQIIAFAVCRPRSVSLNEILVRPTGQALRRPNSHNNAIREERTDHDPSHHPDPATEQRRADARHRARRLPDAPDETRDAVRAALSAGYRHIDTAAAYGNERQVGEAVHSSDLERSDVFLETKIWISDYGYEETLHGFEKSAGKFGLEQLDLLILHQALPSAFDRTLEAYRALETLLADGKVRAIGVSNFWSNTSRRF
jgi:hypothetical protein